MSENKQFVVQNDGRQIITDDLNLLGETGALASDRVYASLLQMTPGDGSTVTKAVWPNATAALVASSGVANGSVTVKPCRVFVGSRTAPATEARKSYRDIRSAISVAEGATSLDSTVALGSLGDASNPRWVLVYAAVSIDANATSVTRKIKDPTTKAITATSVVTSIASTMSIGVTAGTAAASPVWPSTPADSGSTYYIPLAYVRLPAAFNASSTVAKTAIAEVAPCLPISRSTGTTAARTTNTAQTLTSTQQQAWGSSGTRPGWFLPSTMVGEETLYLALDLTTGSESHANGAVLDTGDWRGRFVRWEAHVGTSFDWASSADNAANLMPPDSNEGFTPLLLDQTAQASQMGFGQTFHHRSVGGQPAAMWLNTGFLTLGADVQVYCDFADGGKLKLGYSGAPNKAIFAILRFSPPVYNTRWV